MSNPAPIDASNIPPELQQQWRDYENFLQRVGVRHNSHEIGRGAYGRVYDLDLRVAKCASPRLFQAQTEREKCAQSMYREATILSLLQRKKTKGVPKLFGYKRVRGLRYTLVMNNMGLSLHDQFIKTGQTIPTKLIRDRLEGYLKITEGLHRNGVFHLDIKPANITKKGLVDFGLSSQGPFNLNDRLVQTSWYRDVILNLLYNKYASGMIPQEEMDSLNWPGLDIWSWGCVFFQLLTGAALAPVSGEDTQATVDRLHALQLRLNIPDSFWEGRASETLFTKYRSEDGKETWRLRKPSDHFMQNIYPRMYRIEEIIRFSGEQKGDSPQTTQDALELVRKMLEVDPTKRPSIKKLLEMPFFTRSKVKFFLSPGHKGTLTIFDQRAPEKSFLAVDLGKIKRVTRCFIPRLEPSKKYGACLTRYNFPFPFSLEIRSGNRESIPLRQIEAMFDKKLEASLKWQLEFQLSLEGDD